jgi:hypothetical protein
MTTPMIPETVDATGKAVGARVKPHWASLLCYPPCAISGYEHGDPTSGMFEGKAMWAFILEILCCAGCIVSLCCWQPDPSNIKGDGTQRTVENKCMAGFCVGFTAIAFWENGDFCCTPDGQCTWCTEGALVACLMHFVPSLLSLPPLDCCYVMCCWNPETRNFKRSTQNDGGGQQLVGAPVQASGPWVPLWQAQMAQAPAQVVGQVVGQQPAQQGQYGNMEYGNTK